MNNNKILRRERVDHAMDKIFRYPLTILSATMGYGKTTAVRNYMENKDIKAVWVSLLGCDGEDMAFWHKLCASVERIYPGAGNQLKNLGFPKDAGQLMEVLDLIWSYNNGKAKVLVIDDFHYMNHNIQLGKLIEVIAEEEIPDLHIILVSRNRPLFNHMNLFAKGLCYYLNTELLAFNQQEIKDYLEFMGYFASGEEIKILDNYTNGWITAIYLLLLGLKQGVPVTEVSYITQLVENNLYSSFEQRTKQVLLKLSVVDSFTMPQAVKIAEDIQVSDIIEQLMEQNAFIQYDRQTSLYQLHAVLLDFLREKFQDEEVKRHVCHCAGQWYFEQGDFVLAIDFYHRAGKIEALLEQMNQVKYMHSGYLGVARIYEVFKEIPEEWYVKYPNPLLHFALCFALNHEKHMVLESERILDILEAHYDKELNRVLNEELNRRSNDALNRVSNEELNRESNKELNRVSNKELSRVSNDALNRESNKKLSRVSNDELNKVSNNETNDELNHELSIELNPAIDQERFSQEQILGEIEIVRIFLVINDAKQMVEHSRKAYQLLHGGVSSVVFRDDPFTFGVPHFLYSYYREAGKLQETVECLKEGFPPAVFDGNGTGCELVAMAEYALETGDFKQAEIRADQAVYKAGTADQVCVQINANFTKLRLFLVQGNFDQAKELLSLTKTYLTDRDSKVNAMCKVIYKATIDMCEGYLYGCLQEANMIPEWLRTGEMPSRVLMMHGFAFQWIIYGKAILLSKNWTKLEILCEKFKEEYQIFHNQLGFLHNGIYEACAKFHLHGMEVGLKALLHPLEEAKMDNIILPFAEHCDSVLPMLYELRRQNRFDQSYLENVIKLCEQYKSNLKKIRTADKILTERETQVIKLLSQGMTQREIANTLYCSTSTVKKHLESIYRKLNVNNKISAVQAAQNNKII